MLNIALVAAEAKWHLIYRLTIWDIAQLRTLAPLFTQLAHPGAAITAPHF